MTNQEVLVAGGRILSREPSPAIHLLSKAEPSLYATKRGRLCRFTPLNMIGSLMVELESRDKPRQGCAVEILEDVPLSIYFDHCGYVSKNVVLPEVLYKRACGESAGLVLHGQLTGLILSARTDVDPNLGMCVNRVWNDSQINPRTLPYTPNHLRGFFPKPFDKYDICSESALSVTERFNVSAEYERRFWLEAVKVSRLIGRFPTELDMLFYLCDRLGIDVEKDAFHYTLSSKSLINKVG